MKPFEVLFTARERLKIELLALGYGARLGWRGRVVYYLCLMILAVTQRNARKVTQDSKECRQRFMMLKATRPSGKVCTMKPFEVLFTAKERLKLELLALGYGARLGWRGRVVYRLCLMILAVTQRNARKVTQDGKEVRQRFMMLKAERLGISKEQFKKLI